MANGNPTPKHKRSSLNKHIDINVDDTDVSLSPLFDIFDNQLQYAIPSTVPSLPYDLYPLPFNHHQHNGAYAYPLSYAQDNTRKKQRRQTAGNMVVNTFFNRGSNTAAAPIGKNYYPVAGLGGGNSVQVQNALKAAKKKQSTAQPRPKIAIPPNGIGPIHDPNINDVLSGRGGRINAHVGNVQFREIVAMQKNAYLAKDTKKLEKAHIAADIVYYVRRMEPSGRFLKEDVNGAWWDIGDQKAIKKVGQALREDAPEIRDPDDLDGIFDPHGDVVTSNAAPFPSSMGDDTTPTQTNRTLCVNSDSPAISLPIPAVTTSAGSNVMMVNKSATAVSGRGGKLSHCNSSSSIRSNQGRAGIQQQQTVSVQIDIRPPEIHKTAVPPQSARRVGQGSTPFYSNLGFRSGTAQRIGAAVSGAAASVMKQQNQPRPIHEFEVPAARNSLEDVAFGRTFHPPPDNPHGESSLLSGLSGGASNSLVSGMSAISALTDPMSSISNSDGLRSIRQQAQLDRIRSNWASSAAVNSSDNTPTIHLLCASNGIGSSLNNVPNMRMNTDQMDDGASWAHSLHGGGIVGNVEETARDDSILFGGTESLLSAGSVGNSTVGGSGGGLLGVPKHTTSHVSTHRDTRNITGGLPAYYPCDASATSGMSLGTTDDVSMAELSENLVALDLSNILLGPMHENEI